MSTVDYTWISSTEELAAITPILEAAAWVAVDTESNSAHVYQEQVCLLQINADGHYFMVDTLALEGGRTALDSIKGVLEDPEKRCYLHGAEYDVICLKRDYDIHLRCVFDSQQAASLLGYPKTGYGALVEEFCEVSLAKAYSQYDWGTRPLDPNALEYAIDDVVYLPRICEQLIEAVATADLEEEVGIACDAVMNAEPRDLGFKPEGIYRVKGWHGLPTPRLSLLLALYTWRDEVARELNQPPGRVLNNEAMVALARNAPKNFGLLKRQRLRRAILDDYGNQILDLVRENLAEPIPVPEHTKKRQVDSSEEAREKRLKNWRKGEAGRREVPLQVVLPAKSIEYLKQHGADDLSVVPQLGPKRAELYGDSIRKVCTEA